MTETPTESSRDEPAPLAPLSPGDPALLDPAPMVRITCPREQRTLWAGDTVPEGAGDPVGEVQRAAGCLADPPTCPCATADSEGASTEETRDALDAASLAPGSPAPPAGTEPLMFQARPALPATGAGLSPALLTPGALGMPPTVAATLSATPQPPMLLTADAYGIEGNGRPAPSPLAFGGDVAGVLEALGIDPEQVVPHVAHVVDGDGTDGGDTGGRPENPPDAQ